MATLGAVKTSKDCDQALSQNLEKYEIAMAKREWNCTMWILVSYKIQQNVTFIMCK